MRKKSSNIWTTTNYAAFHTSALKTDLYLPLEIDMVMRPLRVNILVRGSKRGTRMPRLNYIELSDTYYIIYLSSQVRLVNARVRREKTEKITKWTSSPRMFERNTSIYYEICPVNVLVSSNSHGILPIPPSHRACLRQLSQYITKFPYLPGR